MNKDFDYKANKGIRLLNIYERLVKGEVLNKHELASSFGVACKTIQRDIDDLRAYMSENYFVSNGTSIKYDKSKNGYCLVSCDREWLTNEEVLVLCKILLDSRALCKEEMNTLLNKLKNQVTPHDRKQIEQIIQSEQHYYVPVRHNQFLLSRIWALSQFIITHEMISFTYKRQDGVIKNREVKPVAIMFSEYYFYLIAYMGDGSKDFPTIFRVDRMDRIKGMGQHFQVPYKDRFNEGEFRKRVQFMYTGELRKIKFEFKGPSIEAVLDRLPTAEVLYVKNGVYVIQAEVYGKGIDMWMRSQGDLVKII